VTPATSQRAVIWVVLAVVTLVPMQAYARPSGQQDLPTLRLAVANSTCKVIQHIGALFAHRIHVQVTYICKSSGRLAKGLRGQAIRADYFISANRAWMDHAVEGQLVSDKDVKSPWGNQLVVAAPRSSPLTLSSLAELATKHVDLLLLGDPGTAPFGRYAKQALRRAGIWKSIRRKVETRKHITLVAETLAGAPPSTAAILFSTIMDHRLRTVLQIPSRLHEPIRYFVGPLRASASRRTVRKFEDFLRTPIVTQILRDAGFKVF